MEKKEDSSNSIKSKKVKKTEKGKSPGRPTVLKDRIVVNVCLDGKTDEVLKKIDSSRSHAIRILAAMYEKDYL